MDKKLHSLEELFQAKKFFKDRDNNDNPNFDGYDLSEIDFSSIEGQQALAELQYGTNTIFSKSIHTQMMEKLEKGKDPGFNIRRMHTIGYTGKGITLAIIDQAQDLNNPEFKNRIIHTKDYASSDKPSYHGPAVTSIAVGKTCGVAPEANLIYLSTGNQNSDELDDKALIDLLEYNRSLPENKKIRFLSCSWGKELPPHRSKLFQQLEDEGIMIFGGCWGLQTGRLNSSLTRNLAQSTNDTDAYQECAIHSKLRKGCVAVLRNNRTFASRDGYIFDPIGGNSWTFPYLAGVGACALQANPDFVKQKGWQDKLWQLMLETGIPVSKEQNANRIIQPAKLCEKMHQMYREAHKRNIKINEGDSR